MRRNPFANKMRSLLAALVLANAGLDVTRADTWAMRTVTSLQARVETYAPIWDSEHGVWVSGIGGSNADLTFEDRYAATLDSVTTSSVEGALMYLQRDCIDIGAAPWQNGCKRKNDVKVITFLEVQIVNPNAALAEYQNDRFTYPEFCPFVEMKNGACIYTNDTASPTVVIDNPAECKQYNGLDGQPNIGPCVGAQAFPTDNIAPYFDTVWFSYPNSCVMNKWTDGKNATCRKQYRGGLCPFGTKPDGVNCSFSYKILGFLNIDALVGITAIQKTPTKTTNSSASGDDDDTGEDAEDPLSPESYLGNDSDSGSVASDNEDTDGSESSSGANAGDETGASTGGTFGSWSCPSGKCYKNYTEFCMANQTEFHSSDKDKTLGLRDVKSIEFWGFPSDHRVNKNRTAFMIYTYNQIAKDTKNNMTPLPLDIDRLTQNNPPCYENSLACYDAHYGCQRHSYGQVCTVCREMGAKCVVKVPAYTFPTLTKASRTVSEAQLRSQTVKAPTQKTTASSAGVRLHPRGVWIVVTAIVVAIFSVIMWEKGGRSS